MLPVKSDIERGNTSIRVGVEKNVSATKECKIILVRMDSIPYIHLLIIFL